MKDKKGPLPADAPSCLQLHLPIGKAGTGRQETDGLVRRHQFQSDNRSYQGRNEKQPEKRGRFMKEQNAKQYRAYRTDASPHGISSTNGQSLNSLRKQYHAQRQADQESGSPQIVFRARSFFHLSQTKCETGLKKSGNNQNNPVHTAFL